MAVVAGAAASRASVDDSIFRQSLRYDRSVPRRLFSIIQGSGRVRADRAVDERRPAVVGASAARGTTSIIAKTWDPLLLGRGVRRCGGVAALPHAIIPIVRHGVGPHPRVVGTVEANCFTHFFSVRG